MTLYHLKHFDTTVLSFHMEMVCGRLVVNNVESTSQEMSLVPLDMNPTEESIAAWLKSRVIPANRAYVSQLLARMGLAQKDTVGIINVCKGLSLNDCFWVVNENSTATWSSSNLYTNRMSRQVAHVALTGTGSYENFSSLNSLLRSTPELTTNGMLPKCWVRTSGKVSLFKGGSTGAANLGNEPFSEYLAMQIAQTMKLEACEYTLAMRNGTFGSMCELFTSQDVGFISYAKLMQTQGTTMIRDELDKIILFVKERGDLFGQAVEDMFIFDAVIANFDRHLGNFGVLIDNKANKIIKPAPLFDHGHSLAAHSMQTDFDNIEAFIASMHTPAFWFSDTQEKTSAAPRDLFIQSASRLVSKRNVPMLESLRDFTFTKHSRYNLPNWRIKALESFVRNRAERLLSNLR